MFDVGDSLRDAFDRAGNQLQNAQRDVALANAGATGRHADAAMAKTAQAAIFTEALLAFERSRLAELKSVAK